MASGAAVGQSYPPLTILLVAGPKDHGPGEHDYPAWQQAWAEMLTALPTAQVETAFEWPDAAQWQRCQLAICYFRNRQWSDEEHNDLENFLARGGGLVLLHSAMVASHDSQRLAQLIGISGQRPQLQFRHGPIELQLHSLYEITGSDEVLSLVDETYWELVVHSTGVRVLATAREAGQPRPQIWIYEPPHGRVFGSIPGHYLTTFDHLEYRRLLARGMAWCARVPVERFASFVCAERRVATEGQN